MIETYKRLHNETAFEHKLRLCKAKINKEIDLDWQEIVEVLGLDVHYDHLRKTAYGLIEYDDYLNSYNGVATKILSISDLHIPFQLPISTFSDYIGQVDILQINGDVVDMQSISKFPKQYRVSPMEEIILGRQYLIDLIDYIKPKKVVINWGNHDKRFAAYLAKNLDTDLLELMPDTALELIVVDGFKHYDKRSRAKIQYPSLLEVFSDTNIEIEYVDDWKVKIGKTWFAHPFAFSSGTLKTCEKAMDYFHKTDKELFDTVVMAHTHKTAYAKKGFINLYEQGACCQTSKMNYMDGKLSDPQKEGFVFICQNENGELIDTKSKLIKLN